VRPMKGSASKLVVKPRSAWWSPDVFQGLPPITEDTKAPMMFAAIKSRITRAPADHMLVTDPSVPKRDGYVRLVCVSDTHTMHGVVDPLPAGDILVHAGDFTDTGSADDVRAFCAWLRQQQQFRHKVVIAGNHDLSLDPEWYSRNYRRFGHRTPADPAELTDELRGCCTFLDHEAADDVCGLRFFGSPFSPFFYDWAFNLDRVAECRAACEVIHEAHTHKPIDVLVTHGPPLGHGDVAARNGHQGCWDLLDFVEAFPPSVHIFGHIHEGHGATTNHKSVFVNASTMNVRYDPDAPNRPIVIDVPLPSHRGEWLTHLHEINQ
jgi:Icc-related predicted phosphoesterase